MRGLGYYDDLLAAGTALLGARAEGGIEKPPRADTDAANAPTAAAGRREYVVDLTRAESRNDSRPARFSPMPG